MFFTDGDVISAPPQSADPNLAFDADFRAALMAAIPPLRAYARSMAGNADTADDLVQETLVKAWAARARFIPGTNMRAWTHVILRNLYYSQARRVRFTGEWNDLDAELRLAVPARQDGHVALADLARAMQQLPDEQREALIMMGAGGMSCEEVASLCNCAVGTIKSRVARARVALRNLLENGQLAQRRSERPQTRVSTFDQIMHEAVALSQPRLSQGSSSYA